MFFVSNWLPNPPSDRLLESMLFFHPLNISVNVNVPSEVGCGDETKRLTPKHLSTSLHSDYGQSSGHVWWHFNALVLIIINKGGDSVNIHFPASYFARADTLMNCRYLPPFRFSLLGSKPVRPVRARGSRACASY